MKPLRWSAERRDRLKAERGPGFEAIVVAIESGGLLDILTHPNPARYPHQRVLVVELDGYAYLAPCVEAWEHSFPK